MLEDSVRVELKEMECGGIDWINLTQRQASVAGFLNTALIPRVP